LVTTDGSDYTIATKVDGTISPKSTEPENSKETTKIEEPKKDKTQTNHCIDINQASLEEVQSIIHIGPERAQTLIDLRPFVSVDDLERIKGIGPARITDNKDEGLACVK